MQYDLPVVADLSSELGFKATRLGDSVEIRIEEGVTLVFQNLPSDDCLLGFAGCDWHTHGDLIVSDARGYTRTLSYLDVVSGIATGVVLLCELWRHEQLSDRWLVHREYVDEFRFLVPGDEIRIRPVLPPRAAV